MITTSEWSSHDVVSGEDRHVLVPYNWRKDGTQRAVIHCHGGGSDWTPSFIPLDLANWGFLTATADLSGLSPFANDASITKVTELWTMLKTTWGAKTDKVILSGTSMGFQTAAVWALSNLSSTAAIAGYIPLVDPEDTRVNNRDGQQASIEAIYGAATPVPDAKNPARNTASYTHPIKLWYSTNDPRCWPQTVTDFDTAVASCTLVSLGAVSHDFTTVPTESVASFLDSYRA